MLSHFSHCLILCDPMGCSPPGSSFHGILQARMLEWVAMPSSRGSSRPRARTLASYVSCVGRRVLYHQCHQWSQKFPNCWRDWLATPDVSQDQVPGRGTWSMSGRNDDSEMAEWDLSRCVSKRKELSKSFLQAKADLIIRICLQKKWTLWSLQWDLDKTPNLWERI